jgi:photolyase PhrII
MASASAKPIDVNRLPRHLFERVRVIRNAPVETSGEFVLYWMHHAVRSHENSALDTALYVATLLKLPVLVYQGLGGRHPFNSDRHHTFIMEGAREVQQQLQERGISYAFYLGRRPNKPSPLKSLAQRAALVISEDFPAPPFPKWTRQLAQQVDTAVWIVDCACIIPMRLIQGTFDRAYAFRNHTQKEYERRLPQAWDDMVAVGQPFEGKYGFETIDLAKADIAELCTQCDIDHTIPPVAHTPGGSTAGYARWEKFKRHGLKSYSRLRNDAKVLFPKGVSRISAYLHHGHVSPFRIARDAARDGSAGAVKFLDEMLIWRELAHHFCFHRNDLTSLDSIPQWARQTLMEHQDDPREVVYSWERLYRGQTGDALWDAAQKSLLVHGELHNNVRMTWGKAFLNWTRHPQDALDLMIDLNHRFALDGNDPNSYGGLLWCLGLFDRPFKPERPVIGTLRPRSTKDHAKRLNMAAYAAKVKMQPCLAAMAAFEKPLNLPFDTAFIHQSPVRWAARNNSKPKRPAAECCVFHAIAEWSQTACNGKDDETAVRSLLVSFFESIGRTFIEPMYQRTCYWRSAAAVKPLSAGCLWDAELKIGVCGDWCQMSRVEGAALSGMAMAGKILGMAAKIQSKFQESAE